MIFTRTNQSSDLWVPFINLLCILSSSENRCFPTMTDTSTYFMMIAVPHWRFPVQSRILSTGGDALSSLGEVTSKHLASSHVFTLKGARRYTYLWLRVFVFSSPSGEISPRLWVGSRRAAVSVCLQVRRQSIPGNPFATSRQPLSVSSNAVKDLAEIASVLKACFPTMSDLTWPEIS
jgi:hypothetical protein